MAARPGRRMSSRVYLALLPWIVFSFVARGTLEGVTWGAVLALFTALAVTRASARVGSVKELEVFAVGLFAVLAVAGALDQHDPNGVLQRFHNGIAMGALTVFALASLAYRPFTDRFAREVVLRRYWETPRFARANVELTLMWTTMFAAITASQVLGAALATRLGSTVFTWVVPIGIVIGGVRQALLRWSDQFDGESMSLDAMLNQGELWDGPASPSSGRPRHSWPPGF